MKVEKIDDPDCTWPCWGVYKLFTIYKRDDGGYGCYLDHDLLYYWHGGLYDELVDEWYYGERVALIEARELSKAIQEVPRVRSARL